MISAARAAALAAALVALLGAAPVHAKGKALAPGERVDLNRATVAELMRLPGVGRKRAEAIAALRDRRPFRRIDDVTQVKGISPAWVQKHRAALDATGAAAPVNAAKAAPTAAARPAPAGHPRSAAP